MDYQIWKWKNVTLNITINRGGGDYYNGLKNNVWTEISEKYNKYLYDYNFRNC